MGLTTSTSESPGQAAHGSRVVKQSCLVLFSIGSKSLGLSRPSAQLNLETLDFGFSQMHQQFQSGSFVCLCYPRSEPWRFLGSGVRKQLLALLNLHFQVHLGRLGFRISGPRGVRQCWAHGCGGRLGGDWGEPCGSSCCQEHLRAKVEAYKLEDGFQAFIMA